MAGILLDLGLDVAHDAVGSLDRRAFGHLDLEREFALRQRRNQLAAQLRGDQAARTTEATTISPTIPLLSRALLISRG